jgi:acetylornithine/succinyldiaminopimelate/putrescine aminotransferase
MAKGNGGGFPISRVIERCKLAKGAKSHTEMLGELTMAEVALKSAIRSTKEAAIEETAGQTKLPEAEGEQLPQ